MIDYIVKRIELTPIRVPFKEQVRKVMSSTEGGVGMAIPVDEEWLGGDFVICKLIDSEGNEGIGEAFVWLPETGVSPAQIIDSIQNALKHYLIGEDIFNLRNILTKMNNNVARNEVAKGLLDIAGVDLMGKINNEPAWKTMRGTKVNEIPLCALIPLGEPILMKGITRSYIKKGFKTIRLKLGRSIEEDVEIVSTVRKAIGPDIRIRVDYNQAYSAGEAIEAINAIEEYNIDVAEQPVDKDNYAAMTFVQQNVNIPLMAHEGCFSLRDIESLINLHAIKVVGINSERPGGTHKALQAIAIASVRNMGVVLHNQPLGISSAWQIHLASAKFDDLGHAIELFGDEMLEDDLIKKPLDYSNGTAKLPEGPGYGVELDEDALQKYKTSETVVIK